jgi:hypothetical protein
LFLISTSRQAQQKYLCSFVFIAEMLNVSVDTRPSSGKNTFSIKEESVKTEASVFFLHESVGFSKGLSFDTFVFYTECVFA